MGCPCQQWRTFHHSASNSTVLLWDGTGIENNLSVFSIANSDSDGVNTYSWWLGHGCFWWSLGGWFWRHWSFRRCLGGCWSCGKYGGLIVIESILWDARERIDPNTTCCAYRSRGCNCLFCRTGAGWLACGSFSWTLGGALGNWSFGSWRTDVLQNTRFAEWEEKHTAATVGRIAEICGTQFVPVGRVVKAAFHLFIRGIFKKSNKSYKRCLPY